MMYITQYNIKLSDSCQIKFNFIFELIKLPNFPRIIPLFCVYLFCDLEQIVHASLFFCYAL